MPYVDPPTRRPTARPFTENDPARMPAPSTSSWPRWPRAGRNVVTLVDLNQMLDPAVSYQSGGRRGDRPLHRRDPPDQGRGRVAPARTSSPPSLPSDWRRAPTMVTDEPDRPPRRPTSTARRPPARSGSSALDGLRAVALLIIMGYHFGVGWLQGGFFSLDIFYVLSGYLITGLLVERVPRARPDQARRPSGCAGPGGCCRRWSSCWWR